MKQTHYVPPRRRQLTRTRKQWFLVGITIFVLFILFVMLILFFFFLNKAV